MVTSHVPFEILMAPSISQEWLKLELSNFVHREILSRLAKGMTNHTWGARFGSYDPFFMPNCRLQLLPWHTIN